MKANLISMMTLAAALALAAPADAQSTDNGNAPQSVAPARPQGAGVGFVDADGDGICDRYQAGQQGQGRGQRGKRGGYGPGDGTGNQGVGPQDGTGYGGRLRHRGLRRHRPEAARAAVAEPLRHDNERPAQGGSWPPGAWRQPPSRRSHERHAYTRAPAWPSRS